MLAKSKSQKKLQKSPEKPIIKPGSKLQSNKGSSAASQKPKTSEEKPKKPEVKPSDKVMKKEVNENFESSTSDISIKDDIINQNLFSLTYKTDDKVEIMLPKFNEEFYIDFMEKLIFGKDLMIKKKLIVQPLPPQINQLFFLIKRKQNLINPSYELLLEKGGNERVSVMFAYKKKMTINNYYQIQLDSDMKTERNSEKCIGKLRATNHDNDSYMLYDTGEAYDSK